MRAMGSWMQGCLIGVIVSDWLRLIKSWVIAALAVRSYVTAETKAGASPAVWLLKRTSLLAWLGLCPPCLICINNWGLSPEDTWLQNMSAKHKGLWFHYSWQRARLFFLAHLMRTTLRQIARLLISFLLPWFYRLMGVLLCVPAAARSSQSDPPQSGRLPSARCWTWLSFCETEVGKRRFQCIFFQCSLAETKQQNLLYKRQILCK